MFIKICGEYGVSNDLTSGEIESISQHGKAELGKQISLVCRT